jgi:hypothetical protein
MVEYANPAAIDVLVIRMNVPPHGAVDVVEGIAQIRLPALAPADSGTSTNCAPYPVPDDDGMSTAVPV